MTTLISYQRITLFFRHLLSEVYTNEEIMISTAKNPPFMIQELIKCAITLWNLDKTTSSKVKAYEFKNEQKSLWDVYLLKKRDVKKSFYKINKYQFVDAGIIRTNDAEIKEDADDDKNKDKDSKKEVGESDDDDNDEKRLFDWKKGGWRKKKPSYENLTKMQINTIQKDKAITRLSMEKTNQKKLPTADTQMNNPLEPLDVADDENCDSSENEKESVKDDSSTSSNEKENKNEDQMCEKEEEITLKLPSKSSAAKKCSSFKKSPRKSKTNLFFPLSPRKMRNTRKSPRKSPPKKTKKMTVTDAGNKKRASSSDQEGSSTSKRIRNKLMFDSLK